jgi:hypothetical protein
MAQQKRGFKFALSKIESLLEVVKAIVPTRNPNWEKILNKHASCYPKKDHTTQSLKRKFQELAYTKIPTGDLIMPPHICKAKHIYYKIVLATDGSTGGSDDGGGELNDERDDEFEEDEEEEDDEEGGMVDINNNDFSFSADKEQLTMDGNDASHIDAAAAAAAVSGRRSSDGKQLSVLEILSRKRRSGEASSSKEMRDGGQKKKPCLSMPFKTPRKKSSCTDDSYDDGFLFGSMMCA